MKQFRNFFEEKKSNMKIARKSKEPREKRDITGSIRGMFEGIKLKSLIPVISAIVVAGAMLNLGLTQFDTYGYLAEDSFAVPQNTLSTALRSGETDDKVKLLSVEMGETVYTRLLSSSDYFIGDEKKPVSSGYPLFARNGQVLYFINDEFNLVTNKWEKLGSYDGLYLNDGVTYNAGSSRADLNEVMLVEVENGYQVAQETKLISSSNETTIDMNSVCAFSESEIVYYSVDKNNTLVGNKIPVAEGASIEIGDNSFSYLEFLEKLGLWREKPEKVPEKVDNVPEEPKKEEVDKTPAPPKENPDSKPKDPERNPNRNDKDPAYKEPTVSFGTLDPWVYTISTEAVIEDPAKVLRNGGVQIYIYEIKENGEESRVLRQTANNSGTVTLGQIAPSGKYHVVAEYEHYNEKKKIVKKTIDLGTASTLSFDNLKPVKLSLRDETEPVVREDDKVEIFSMKLQCRDLVFSNISNGTVVQSGGNTPSAGSSDASKKAEGYVNYLEMIAVAEDGQSSFTMKMDSKTVSLLRNGFTVSSWDTAESLASATKYTYTFKMKDRYGNEFTVSPNKSLYEGHTCKRSPSVSIRVPGETNTVNSTQVNVSFNNPQLAVIDVDSSANALINGKAAMFVYKADDPSKTPIMLSAYRVNDRGQHIDEQGRVVSGTEADTSGYYLPVEVNRENGSASVTTQWVLKDLVPFETYTAAVVCGKYDIDDGKQHLSEILDRSESFATVVLRSKVSYTAEVDKIKNDNARLKFSMNTTDSSLIPIIDNITFSLEKTLGRNVGSFTLRKTDLENCSIGQNPVSGTKIEVPVAIEGKPQPVTAEVELLFDDYIPALPNGATVETVWDYILATSNSDSENNCWLAINLGDPVFELQERTEYTGKFTTEARLGGEYIDVTSSSSRNVKFRTISAAASVNYNNIFVADDFIEIFGLQIIDGGNCIQKDVENRGGNVSITIYEYLEGALNPVGNQYLQMYINSKDYDQPADESLKISGLEKDKQYVMIFHAQRYDDGSSDTPEQNRALEYTNPDENLDSPTWFVFQTGESVSGELSLLGVSQQYYGDDGELTGTLSMLNESDFYYGVLKDYNRVYYAEEEALENFRNEITADKEIDLSENQIEKLKKNMDLSDTDKKTITPYVTTSYKTENMWNTRFIKVVPGEKYAIYDVDDMSYQRINFYYSENDGPLTYYTYYTASEYFRGGVFQVPATAQTANRQYYMCISGANRQMANTMILEKYDETKTAQKTNLGEGAEVVKGMTLGTTNGLSINETYGYVSDYISGIVGGAVYEIKGRDLNRSDDNAMLGSNSTTGLVLFYDRNYAFIGSFYVSNQTALVKAPFGAAYCRFNVSMKKVGDEYVAPSWDDKMSVKLYRNIATDRYSSTIRMNIMDQSAAQILKGGKYKVTIYRTDSYRDESTDLSTLDPNQWHQWNEESWDVDSSYQGEVNIRKILNYDNMPVNRGFKVCLSVQPAGWENEVTIDTIYFTTNKVITTISNLSELLSVRNNPAGSYVVVEDITGLNGSVLGNNRPFTGTIDFQGHSVTTTSFSPLFYRISEGGVVKNVEVIYNAQSANNYITSSCAPVTYTNYGTIQNVVVRYNGHNSVYGADVYHSGGIATFNNSTGVIDGFVVEFQQDVRVTNYFGGVCYHNSGTVSNGYVTGVELPEAGRRATVVHKYKDEAGQIIGNSAYYHALGVGYNASKGKISNVYVVGDLIIESEKGDTNTDITSSGVDTSVAATGHSGVLVGRNRGELKDVFATGDRWDYGYDGVKTVMKQRGPAVAYIDGTYDAENVSYFSNYDYETSTSSATVGTFNVHAENESLYEYRWHEDKLGTDGTKFNIRSMIEKDGGYYPQLILPECFGADFVQPLIPLESRNGGKVEILYNEVRVQGINEALVTVSIANPFNEEVMGFNIYDDTHPTTPLNCEVLAQGPIGDSYQVDILISMQKDQYGYAKNDAQNRYTIKNVIFRNGERSVSDRNGEKYIHAEFWKEIASEQDWMDFFSKNAMTTIKGNYLLTADLDFTESDNSKDWFCYYRFNGTLNGGIYSTDSDSEKVLTDYMGNVLTDEEGNELKIKTFGRLIGMHTISGVGNMDKNGTYNSNRAHQEYSNSLFREMYGTLKNIVFKDFHSLDNSSIRNNNTKSYRAGVVAYAGAGAKIDNCHVRSSNFFGRRSSGALIGEMSGATVTNCSAADVQVEILRISQGTDEINAGGLIGYTTGGSIENCFASGVSVKAADVYNSNGMGGLVGYVGDSTVESCYATGTVDIGGGKTADGMVDSSAARVGGIAGQMAGESTISECWSTTTVMTAADFAGGVVGYHNGGVLRNNYTSSTLITRSLAATSVHRICNNTAFDEASRIDNYAFRGQYITYIDPEAPAKGESLYQFGTWSELDGATRLLTEEELKQSGTWTNQIGLSDNSFDMDGTAGLIIGYDDAQASSTGGTPLSGTRTVSTAVSGGYMPKLKHTETGMLLYDQSSSEVGYSSDSVLSRIAITRSEGTIFHVKLALFTMREDLKNLSGGVPSADKKAIADWENMSIIGGKVNVQPGTTVTDSIKKIAGGYNDAELSPVYGAGWQFEFDVDYGGENGHYLDSYILSIPVYTESPYDSEGNIKPYTPTETIQVRLGLDTGDPIYKDISSVSEWNEFFDPSGIHANFFENVRITNDLKFMINEDGSIPEGTYLNVKVNRLVGYKTGGGRVTISTGTVGDSNQVTPIIFKYHGGNLISQAVTEVSNIDFKDMSLSSAIYKADGSYQSKWGGAHKGVIGLLQGNIKNVSFTNIDVDGGDSSCVGMVGRIYGEAKNVTLKNISVTSNSSYIGGLAGYADSYSTIDGIKMTADTGKRNTINTRTSSQIGGVVGHFEGIMKNVEVSDTDVSGREYVGGAVGYAIGNGNRPGTSKMENVIIGAGSKEAAINTSTPGIIDDKPDVTVKIAVKDATGSAVATCGGAVGYGNGQIYNDLQVYNTRVGVDYDSSLMTNSSAAQDNYAFYVGGIAGRDAGQMQNSIAENCTVSTPGSYAGGISSNSVRYYNKAVDCVVYGERPESARIGGVIGAGGAERCIAQHCVVSGGTNIGGIAGYADGYCRQSGVLDSIIVGKTYVGGIGGYNPAAYVNSDYVLSTDTSSGNGSVSYVDTTVANDMLAPQFRDSAHAKTYTGTYIEGDENVGGLVGGFKGLSLSNNTVGMGVTIKGNSANTGGFVGEFYAARKSTWRDNLRAITNSHMGATVNGKEHTGGIIGWYTREDDYNPNIATSQVPVPSQFYGILITGSVDAGGLGNGADLLVGGIDKSNLTAEGLALANNYDALSGTYFGYCRVWKNSTVDGTSFDGRVSEFSAGTKDTFQGVLTVDAADMTDENMYFMPRNTTYGGMGWSREAWNAENMQKLYPATSTPSSFSKYKSGIKKENMILWLDGKNNTGNGYTDEESATWKDLSDSGGNDASLCWNNRTGEGASNTIAERSNYMFWNDGALEFSGSSNPNYYAQLNNSISGQLNSGNGFTVEIVYSHSNTTITNSSVKFGWIDGSTSGGFGAAFYNKTDSNTSPYITGVGADGKVFTTYGNIASGDRWYDHNKTLYRTETYVFDRSGNIMKIYQNGIQVGIDKAVGKDLLFPDNGEITRWRIGNVSNYNYFLRVSGVRVYNTPLDTVEIMKNAAYDQWYYFGGSKPTSAESQAAGGITLDANGVVSGGSGSYTLMRSEDGSYSGTVAYSGYNGQGLGSRGHYYVVDSIGNYSNIVTKTGAVYGPILRSTDIAGNEYYGVPANRNVNGQEGYYSNGMLRNVNDRLYQGGWRLPDFDGYHLWEPGQTSFFSLMMGGLDEEDMPEVTAYSSGIDTINLEMLCDPEGLFSYEVYDTTSQEEELKPVLAGTWPTDSRTITMSWDYQTPFVLRLICGETYRDFYWDSSTMARTVMLYGDGYWYLYGDQCYYGSYGSDEQLLFSENYDDIFIHMKDGKILDENGQIWDCESSSVVDSVRKPFYIVKPTATVWSGKVDNVEVKSFGTYMISEGESALCKEQSLIFKDGEPYILQEMVPNNYIANKYQNGSQVTNYLTVLKENGTLRDDYESLTYPEDFRYTGISEIADNSDYTAYKPIALVRYRDGTLAAFDYSTGEVIPVLTDEPTMSLFDYVSEGISTFGLRSLFFGSGGGGMRGLAYEGEVGTNYSLRMALAEISGTIAVSGSNEETGPNISEEADVTQEEQQQIIQVETATDRYVTVYDEGKSTGSVYNLAEYLNIPEDKIVSQEERSKELEKKGFKTTLSAGSKIPEEEASGLLLMYLTAAVSVVLLICMAVLKKKKLDKKPDKEMK